MTKRQSQTSFAAKPWLWLGLGVAVALGFIWSGRGAGGGEQGKPGEPESGAPAPALAASQDSAVSAPLDLPLHVFDSHLAHLRFAKDGSTLAFGSEGTTLRSTDDGQTWQPIPVPTSQFLITSVADPRSGSIIVVGTRGTILRSDDSGQNFVPVRVDTDRSFRAIAIAPDGNLILTVGDDGMAYVSRDAGRSFTAETTPRPDYLSQVVALPKRGRFVVAGDNGALLLRDDTAGWRAITTTTREAGLFMALSVLPDGRLLAGTQSGVIFSSTDDGDTWTEIYKTGTDSFVAGFDVNDTGSLVTARMRRGDLLLSSDQGKTFETTALGTKPGVAKLVWMQGRGFIGVAGDGGALSSDLAANRWSTEPSPIRDAPLAMGIHPVTGTVIVTGRSGLIARSTDHGKRYQLVRQVAGGSLRAFADDSAAGCLVGVGMGATVVHSLDAGKNWQRVPLDIGPQIELSSVVVEPKSAVLLAGGSAGTLLRSRDCARTWAPIRVANSNGSSLNVSSLVVGENSTILALADQSPVRRSVDAGSTFSASVMETDASLKRAVAVAPGEWVAVGDGGRVYRSSDDAKSFQRLASGTEANLRALAYDPAHRALWTAGDAGTVLRSTDAGVTWQRIAVPTEENLFVIGLDPAGDVVWIGGNHGTALRTSDQGAHFTNVASGSTQTIRVIAFDPPSKEFVIAGAGGTLLRTVGGTRIATVKANLEGRIDAALFHAPSGAMFLGGERLIRLGR